MTKRKITALVLGVLVLVSSGGIVALQTGTKKNTKSTNVDTSQTTAVSATSTYTLAEISQHKDAESCWSAINGGVYDLTKWISSHPGGEGAILSICGADGSAAFNGQHGDNTRANKMLATFKIGTLK